MATEMDITVNPHPRIRRSMGDWLDEPIDRNAERLFDLAAEFWGDECLVNFFGTKKMRTTRQLMG